MNADEFNDLTRKAMVREYMNLKQDLISVIDAANDITSFIEANYASYEELDERLEAYDTLIDSLKI
jgi:hypothetical protein